jgi:hypothetical protein
MQALFRERRIVGQTIHFITGGFLADKDRQEADAAG